MFTSILPEVVHFADYHRAGVIIEDHLSARHVYVPVLHTMSEIELISPQGHLPSGDPRNLQELYITIPMKVTTGTFHILPFHGWCAIETEIHSDFDMSF